MKLIRLMTVMALALAPALRAADEASALAVLDAKDSTLHAKAMACDELGRVGTSKSVPVLAKLLADEKLHDYARDGLERIKDPAAGKALLASLATLEGSLRIGVIITLGDRGDEAAVPELAKIAMAEGKDAPVAAAALDSLAQIASDAAGEAILKTLSGGAAEAKKLAAHAALTAAQRMEKDGRKEAAAKFRQAAADAGVPAAAKKPTGKSS